MKRRDLKNLAETSGLGRLARARLLEAHEADRDKGADRFYDHGRGARNGDESKFLGHLASEAGLRTDDAEALISKHRTD